MEEEQYEGELTFKMIWEKIKRSGVRIIVYVLIGLIIAVGVMGICNIIVTKSQYETNVTYYYNGVEDGNDPWGGQMSLVNNIRASAVVRGGLAACGYDEEKIDKLVGAVIKNLSVVPTTSNEKTEKKSDGTEELISAAFNYRIILTQSSEIDGLINSRNEYSTIVAAITEEYIKNFKSNFSIATNLPTVEKVAAGSAINTIQNLYELKQRVRNFAIESSSWENKVDNFISPSQKTAFSSLSAQIASLALKLDSFELFVLQNGINGNGESEYVALSLSKYEIEVQGAQNSVRELQAAWESNTTIIDPSLQGSTIVLKDTDLLQKQLISAISKLETAQNNKGIWQGYKESYDKYGDTFAAKSNEEKAELYRISIDKANEVIEGYNALIGVYQGMIKDFNDGYSINSLVRMTSGAKQTNTSPLTKMTFIIILAVVVIIAVVVAMIVTSKKGELKIKALSAKKEAEKTDVENNGVEQHDSIMIEVAAENQDKTE